MRYLVLMFLSMLIFSACNSQESGSGIIDSKPMRTDVSSALNAEHPIQSINQCPVTKNGAASFVPTAPELSISSAQFWFGTGTLWTSLPESGEWNGLPHTSDGYSQKTFWWSKGYSTLDEPNPELNVSGKRLDLPTLVLKTSPATHAFASDIGSAMLSGVVFPSTGCWEITSQYKGGSLTYVIWLS